MIFSEKKPVTSTRGLKMPPHYVYLIKYIFVALTLISTEGVSTKSPPWAKKHAPPPPPALPPLPSHSVTGVPSICSLRICNCTNVLLGGEEVVDISCVCGDEERSIRISQPMLPTNADTLSMSDCDEIELLRSYIEPWTPGQHDEEEDSDYQVERPPSNVTHRPLSRLSIHRVTRLDLSSHAIGPVLNVALEDIRNIVALPPYSFQPSPTNIPTNAADATWNMHSISFKNISEIKKVSEHAIWNVHLSYFHWVDVNVIIVEDNAVHVYIPTQVTDEGNPCNDSGEKLSIRCRDPRGTFILDGTVLGVLGFKSFDVSGGRHVSIESSHIPTLVPSSISVHGALKFSFFRNFVLRSIAMLGFDVVAKDVEIYKNRFGRVEENALVGVRPMPLENSTFRFEDNLMEEVDLMSLNVGWKIFMELSNKGEYPNVTGFSFKRNAFADCSCPHLGWMVQVAIADDELFSSFYALILNKESANYCAKEPVDPMSHHFPCRLPLAGLIDLFEADGRTCRKVIDEEDICNKFSISANNASKEFSSIHLLTVLVTMYIALLTKII